MQQMREWLEEAGRDWASFGVEQRINVAAGTPDDWRQTADERARSGPPTCRSRRWAVVSRVPAATSSGCEKRRRRSRDRRSRIERYAEEHTTPPEQLLVELEAETEATLAYPEMMAGGVQGRFARVSRLQPGGLPRARDRQRTAATPRCPWQKVSRPTAASTRARSTSSAEVARRYIARSPYADSHHRAPPARPRGDLTARRGFDLPHRRRQDRLHRLLRSRLPRLRGCLIAADNTLSGGRAVDGTRPEIVAFNEHVRQDERVVSVLLPFRDGVTLIRRRS